MWDMTSVRDGLSPEGMHWPWLSAHSIANSSSVAVRPQGLERPELSASVLGSSCTEYSSSSWSLPGWSRPHSSVTRVSVGVRPGYLPYLALGRVCV